MSFTYTALSFIAPENIRFKYRLEGFDEDWVDARQRRMASYTNIPPGEYTFRVIAANNDDVWNEAGASVSFTLAPHFYETTWFYACCILAIAVTGSTGYHLYRTYRDRQQIASHLQAQLAQAELQVLKMQLQPHFLFNTLHAISSLMHTDLDAADEMMARLGDLLRYTLESPLAQEVELGQELEILHHYLEIEQIRFGDRLHVNTDIPQELVPAMVPNLILQPLVENAIQYGVAHRPSGGTVWITATHVNTSIKVTIDDDGPGLTGEPAEGVGFKNTRARLEQLYRGRHQFSYHNGPRGGLRVILEFPLHKETYEPSKSRFQSAGSHR
jgi:two-component sensor histidine kinase